MRESGLKWKKFVMSWQIETGFYSFSLFACASQKQKRRDNATGGEEETAADGSSICTKKKKKETHIYIFVCVHHHEYIYAIDWRSQFTLAGGGDRWDITILYFSQRRGSDSRLFQLLRQKSKKRIEKGPREEYSEFFFFPLLSSSASCFLFFDNFHLKRVSRVQGQHKSTKTEKRKRRQREKKKKSTA